MLASLAMIGLVIGQSAVTVSGLWATHLLLLLPLPQIVIATFVVSLGRELAVGLASAGTRRRRALFGALPVVIVVGALVAFDLGTDYSYHRDLAITGGQTTFSDAIYTLADYLDSQYRGKPVVAMDWGFKRPIQFLTEERINPVEAFGYTPEPTAEFRQGVQRLLKDPTTIYLFRDPKSLAYPRYDAFVQEAASAGKKVTLVTTFYNRERAPLYLLYSAQ